MSAARALFSALNPSRDLRAVAAIAFLLLTGLAAAIAIGITQEFQQASEARARLDRSSETRAQTQGLLSLLQDAEAGQHGYVVTGAPEFLRLYTDAHDRLDGQLRRLAERSRGDAERIRLRDVEALARAKFREMNRAIEARRGNRAAEAMDIALSDRGGRLMDRLRQTVAEMAAAETAALAADRRSADDRESRAGWLTALALAGSLAVTLVASAFAFVHLDRRRHAERAMHRQECLIEMMRTVAAAADAATDFDDALNRTFRGLVRELEPQAGVATRLDPVSGKADPLAWQPEDDSLNKLAARVLTARANGRTVGTARAKAPKVRRLEVLVRDFERAVGYIKLEAFDHVLTDEALATLSHYAAGQLARIAERERILTSLDAALLRREAPSMAGSVLGREQRPAILVAERQPDAAIALEHAFARAGFAADRTASASQARELAASRPYAAILLDLTRPDQDGAALVRDFRAAGPNTDTPLLIISADPQAAAEQPSGSLPALDWMHDHADADRLVRSVMEMLKESDGRQGTPHTDPGILQVAVG